MAAVAAPSPVYSTEQIENWLERIGLPKSFRPRHEPGHDLDDLKRIQQAALATLPFDDAELHYSTHHSVTLDPQGLYERMVVRRLGGYCMQGNTLFEHMLRGLGYRVYSTGARVRPRKNGVPSGDYLGMAHQVNIIKLTDGRKFATDISFGGDGPISPMPLEVGKVIPQIGSRQTRMVRKALGYDPDNQLWLYQIQLEPGQAWHDVYVFDETEYLPQDFGVMSHWAGTSPGSWMTTKYVGVKMIMEDGQIVGKYTIDGGTVKRILHGKSELVVDCKSEPERLEALEKYFTLVFSQEEKDAIRGTPAELKPPS